MKKIDILNVLSKINPDSKGIFKSKETFTVRVGATEMIYIRGVEFIFNLS